MKLNELKPNARKTRKRVGRGDGSGRGTFSGRGMNGQNARAGGGVRLGFEGGQSGVLDRMPKLRGFKNPNRVAVRAINLSVLEENFKDKEKVTIDSLRTKNLISKKEMAKILGNGKITKKVEIAGVPISESAKKAVEKAGGTIS